MDEVQKSSDTNCNIPSSESFKIDNQIPRFCDAASFHDVMMTELRRYNH
jgi:hypothetical protein